MLVLISDLHLTDGSSGATISCGAFEIFAERLRELALAASRRADGRYQPIETIDVLLLGDVLDLIRSTRWTDQERVRPWSDLSSSESANFIGQITNDILAQNEPSLRILRLLTEAGAMRLPPADSRGRPATSGEQQPVEVRLHYLVGNHDWMFHIRHPRYHAIRQAVVRQMGLAHNAETPFPHDPSESPELLEMLRRHKVFARHGDLFDPFNFEGHRETSSLGDAIVIELLNRFSAACATELANELPDATLAGLRELDNVRPVLLVPVWIDGLLERTCPLPEQRLRVKRVWDALVDRFLAMPFVRERDTWRPNDLVDGLSNALRFSKCVSVRWGSDLLKWFHSWRGDGDASYFQHALAEQDFRNRRAKYIVYGHTHHEETVPLDASYADGYVLNQMYFNSGTWRRVHRQTKLAPNEHEFIATDVMTYLTFFQGDERGGRPFETWSGTLAIGPSDHAVYRIDARREDASTQSVSPSALPGHGPHFAPRVAAPGRVSVDRF
ncbi:MAG: hypothetical protein AB7U73_22835 [Pirellulales bacterium]